MGEIKSRLKRLRVIQLAVIVYLLATISLTEFFQRQEIDRWTWMHWVAAGVSLYLILQGFDFRRRLMPRPGELFAGGALNRKSLDRWQVGQVYGFGMAGGVAMWGVGVRWVLDGPLWQASLFYITGIFFLLLWTPRMPAAPGQPGK